MRDLLTDYIKNHLNANYVEIVYFQTTEIEAYVEFYMDEMCSYKDKIFISIWDMMIFLHEQKNR